MKRAITIGGAFLTLSALGLAREAHADDDGPMCSEYHAIDGYQLLRRLSLDLRGDIPTVEEYASVDAASDEDAARTAAEAAIDDYLDSDGFRMSMRRYHQAMLWPNTSNIQLTDIAVTIKKDPNGILRIASPSRANKLHGVLDGSCGNFEQPAADFDPAFPGEHRLKAGKAEGYRMIAPYWDPSNPLKVCTNEARETENVNGVDCSTRAATNEAGCGCGPDLQFCFAPASATQTPLHQSFQEQLLRSVDDAVTGAVPYTDLLLGTEAWQDGRIAFFKKHLANSPSFGKTWDAPDPHEQILDKDFTDLTWTKVDRGAEHAGVLTLPEYLLKFQTARGRVNRFRNAFLCQAFEPPTSTEDTGCDDNAADLTKRCTCRYCHSTLEPMATSFSLFAQAGTTSLADPVQFPRQDSTCKPNDQTCKRFYVNDPDNPRFGFLQPLEFADAHPEYTDRFEKGPRALVTEALWIDGDESQGARSDVGSVANCSARRAFTFFVRRDPDPSEEDLIESLATDFAASNFDFKSLVKEVVMLEQYRRVR